MISRPTLRRFNLFNLQHGSDRDIHVKIQETIYYAESRFFCILYNIITKADSDRQSWCQKLLYRELHFVLSYIGVATSIGQLFEVPIIIRSLADSIAMLREDQLPVKIDPGFLMALDIDVSEKDNKCRMVKRYKYAWWDGRKPRDLDVTDILDKSSISECLEFHRNELLSENGQVRVASLLPTTPALHASAGKDNDESCRHCSEYSQILSATLNDFLDMHRYANSMSTSSETQWNLDMRRASTYHLLHEAAVIKEMAGSPSPSVSHGSDAIISVEEKAKLELDRLRALPPTSHKWTWGTSLTESDILGIGRAGRRANRIPHSGYHLPLRSGPLAGRQSSFPTIPSSHPVCDAMPDEVSAPPDSNSPSIPYFKDHDQLHYDPLGKAKLKSFLSASNLSITYNANHLSEQWASASETNEMAGIAEEEAMDVAETWSSAGEEPGPDDSQVSSSSNHLAERWSTASDNNGTAGIADEWLSASEECNPVIRSRPAGTDVRTEPANQLSSPKQENDPEARVAEQWSSEAEKATGNPTASFPDGMKCPDDNTNCNANESVPESEGIAEQWSSASDDEDGSLSNVAEEWSSASDTIDSNEPATMNSQDAVTPSRITIDDTRSVFPFSDAWPSLSFDDRYTISPATSTLVVPGPVPPRRYGPEDFNYLQDDMFEDELSEEESE